ncbi:MAG TPA: DUF971 domain-containing protein [Thermoanaerobaculia bacterium]|nr:DUF971 domain-containing protein [Thermoanaerobaculia bacterium]
MAGPIPTNVVAVGNELAIVWDDGREDYLPLEKLRRACPCAMCKGESDLLGNVYRGPNRPLTERSFQLVSHHTVGAYALQIVWADGHNDGIYSYETLRRLAAES